MSSETNDLDTREEDKMRSEKRLAEWAAEENKKGEDNMEDRTYIFTVVIKGKGDTPEEAWAHAVSTAAEQLGQDCPDDFIMEDGDITETSDGTFQG